MWDQLTIGYLAALIDGEGSIKTHAAGCNLVVNSTDLDILERAKEWSGMGVIAGPKWNNLSTKPFWRWQVSGRADLVRLLCAIAPIISERKRTTQILPAVNYLSSHVSKPKKCSFCGQWFHKIGWSTANLKSKYCTNSCCKKAAYRRKRAGDKLCRAPEQDPVVSMI